VAAALTLHVTVQLPSAGMLASLKVTAVEVALRELLAPAQVVEGELALVRPAGSVSVNCDCVSAKPFALLKVRVSVETMVGPTVAGENACAIVGASGFGCRMMPAW